MDTPLIKPVHGRVCAGQNVSWPALRAFGSVMLACSLVLSGCSFFGDEASAGASGLTVQSGGGQAVGQSGGQSGDQVQMSGEYRVGPDGKLVSPVDPLSLPVPVLGAEAQFETPEGMEAFAKYVIELIPYTWMTGNTTKLEDISLPDSSWSKDFISKTEARTNSGGWVKGVKIEILANTLPFEIPDNEDYWHIDIEYEQNAFEAYSGSELMHVPAYKTSMSIQAKFINGKWMIFEAGQLK